MSDPAARLNSALEGRYRVERKLGEGGMATVYLADDLRHGRKVALKVLKPELAAMVGADRFLTEIRTTANLTHPHILPLHDSGEADGLLFYVMPHVEGESLRDRLDRERQLPVPDAARIATNLAEALDYAHRQGVVHRDIKPANILMVDGKPVLSDFGIALAVSSGGAGRMTETGLSLGTPHYMSPEQAAGDEHVGPATDIYALGCVLYEMLAGQPPYTGSSPQAILGKILQAEPASATGARPSTPPGLDAAIRRALERIPADRFPSAGAFAAAIADPSFRHGSFAAGDRESDDRLAQMDDRARRWRGVAVVALTVGLAAVGYAALRNDAGGPARVERARINLGTESLRGNSLALRTTISPDGSAIVFADTVGGVNRLWYQARDQARPVPIPGTESPTRVQAPAFSPDGRWLAFATEGEIRKVPAEGGSPLTLADRADLAWNSITWIDDETIAFTGGGYAILTVSASGGPIERLLDPAAGVLATGTVRALPGRRGLLWVSCDDQCIRSALHVLELGDGQDRVLMEDVVAAWPIGDRLLLYVERTGRAFVRPFDLELLEFTGPPRPVLEGVRTARQYADLQVSPEGTAVYVEGPSVQKSLLQTLSWVRRDGTAEPLDTTWVEAFRTAEVSPDGRSVAVEMARADGLFLWVYDLESGALNRLGEDGGSRYPVWTPDGRHIVYTTQRADGGRDVARRRSDGIGEAEILTTGVPDVVTVAVGPTGDWIVYSARGREDRLDIFGSNTADGGAPMVLVDNERVDAVPSLSPDGRWLVYQSRQSGRPEVYVRSFPDVESERVIISNGGGAQPHWSHSGDEIFYVDADGWIVAARVRSEPRFEVESRQRLFSGEGYRSMTLGATRRWYSVAPDDQRFMMIRSVRDRDPGLDAGELILIRNWFQEIERTTSPDA
jgi:serine/threonine protein kinase/Tol biopolymer transport system component